MDNTASGAATQEPLIVRPEGIPAELIARPQWVVWRLIIRDGRQTKMPYRTDGQPAKSSDPATWTTFAAALAAYQRGGYSGIGYVFSPDDPYVGIDLDDCIDPDPDQGGAPLPWALQIIGRLGTYAETSPSGTGIKLWARGTLPTEATGRKRPYETGAVEAYQRGRYFAVTGQALAGRDDIADAQEGIDWLWAAALADKQPERARRPRVAQDDDLGRVVDRARKYVAAMPEAIEGQGGSDRTMDVACALVLGFALNPDQAYPLMVEYGDRCLPPWSEREIRHKLASAEKKTQERGYLRDAPRNGHAVAPVEETAPPAKKSRDKKEKPAKKTIMTAARMADIITARDHFARDAGNLLYIYDGGVYVPRGQKRVKAAVKEILGRIGQSDEWRKRLAEEVVEYITVDAPELWEHRHERLLNVANGLLDMRSRRLLPHSHEHLSPLQLPVVFDAMAKCPDTERFVGQVFPSDSTELAWEIAAFLISPRKDIQKAVLLLGEGENGKSRYLAQLAAFVGRKNVTAISLHRLESDKFSAARLVGKLANICADLPSSDLSGTSVFKALTGDEFSIPAERKFKESFEFEPFCRLLFSANHPPVSPDASKAFFRRWLPIPFTRLITADERIPATTLDAMLAAPAELSGLLNRALDALPALEKRHDFSRTDSTTEALNDFQATTDPLRIWLESHTQEQPYGHVGKIALRTAYNAWASEHCKPSKSAHAITAAVKAAYPTVDVGQRTIGGAVRDAYIGVGLVADR